MPRVNRNKLPVGELRNGQRKKTTLCTPLEILGRVDELVRSSPSQNWFQAAGTLDCIEELLEEWKNS